MTNPFRASRPVIRVPMFDGELPVLMDDWEFYWRDEVLTIPAGTKTDGASIPRWLWMVCGTPLQFPRVYAAAAHDSAYKGMFKGMSRKEADIMYRCALIAFWHMEKMVDAGFKPAIGLHARVHNFGVSVLNSISVACAWAEYFGVRLFGESHWAGEPDLA